MRTVSGANFQATDWQSLGRVYAAGLIIVPGVKVDVTFQAQVKPDFGLFFGAEELLDFEDASEETGGSGSCALLLDEEGGGGGSSSLLLLEGSIRGSVPVHIESSPFFIFTPSTRLEASISDV